MGIVVYNRENETHNGPDNYEIFRPYILGNPFSEDRGKETLALYRVRDREEALERYDSYFDMMYSGNERFRSVVDEIYEKYKSGTTVYLECYCAPAPCHGDIIKRKMEQRLVRERVAELRGAGGLNENYRKDAKYKEKEVAEIL